MTKSDLRLRPLLVAPSPEGLTMRVLCEAPADEGRPVSTWLIGGSGRQVRTLASQVVDDVRRARPIAADGIREIPRAGTCRRVVVSAQVGWEDLPCTLRVRFGGGLGARRAKCVIDQEAFAGLVRDSGHAECDPGYHEWFCAQRADAAEIARQREAWRRFEDKPLISIVTPVFRTPRAYFEEYLESILSQTYPRFELVLVNVSGPWPDVDDVLAGISDERVRVIEAENRSISENTNVGIASARGRYVAFVDHDDFIEPDALFRYVERINEQPDCDLLFCDEDHWGFDEAGADDGAPQGAPRGRFRAARLKPGWNPDLLFTHDYVCHLLMASRVALSLTQRSGTDVSAAQDYDLTLKVSEVARSIAHVPRVLYHWRDHPASTSSNRDSKPYALEAGRRAVQGHFDRVGLPVQVELGSYPFSYRVRYPRPLYGEAALVVFGEVGPAERRARELARELPAELVVAWATAAELDAMMRRVGRQRVVVLDARAKVEGASWLDETLGQLARPEVGCSAPMIVEADGIVSSAGLIAAQEGEWLGALSGYRADDCGYMSLLEHARDVTAVPLTCLAVRMADYDRVGGFDAALDGDWAAIDLCAKLREDGLYTVVAPYAPVTMPEARFIGADAPQSAAILKRHPWLVAGDPYLDPLLDAENPGFRLPG